MSPQNDRSRKRDAPEGGVRLQKLLAEAGYGSRRACEEFVTAGRVAVDGEVVTQLGTRVDPQTQSIEVDGERLAIEPKKYFLVNKPIGYLSTNSDPGGRPRVIDLLPAGGPRLYPVGRLDENSRGLLLVTNDGEMANKLLHPRYGVPRRYKVQVAGEPGRDVLEQLKEGLHFTEGLFKVRGVKKLKTVGKSTWLELVLTEGRNREIRRLLARVGHKVMKLERIGFGPLKLGRLKVGEYRPLSRREVAELEELVRTNTATGRRAPGKRKRATRKATTGESGTRGPRKRTAKKRTGGPRTGGPKKTKRRKR